MEVIVKYDFRVIVDDELSFVKNNILKVLIYFNNLNIL